MNLHLAATASATATLLALLHGPADAGVTQAAQRAPHQAESASRAAGARPPGGLVVLYDQTANPNGYGVAAQNEEASFDSYDTAAADDFTVPSGSTWKVSRVVVPGFYFGSAAARSLHVTLSRDAAGRPGKVLFDGDIVAADDVGVFTARLPSPLKLKAGTYWLAAYANLDYADGNLWLWSMTADQPGQPSLWQNPGNGFGSGCTTFQPLSACGFGVTSGLMFQVLGTSK